MTTHDHTGWYRSTHKHREPWRAKCLSVPPSVRPSFREIPVDWAAYTAKNWFSLEFILIRFGCGKAGYKAKLSQAWMGPWRMALGWAWEKCVCGCSLIKSSHIKKGGQILSLKMVHINGGWFKAIIENNVSPLNLMAMAIERRLQYSYG